MTRQVAIIINVISVVLNAGFNIRFTYPGSLAFFSKKTNDNRKPISCFVGYSYGYAPNDAFIRKMHPGVWLGFAIMITKKLIGY